MALRYRSGHTESSLISWTDVPPYARNSYVLHGYRPVGVRVRTSGFFSWHNESTNIWTHLVAFFWQLARISVTLRAEAPSADSQACLLLFQCSAACCFAVSAAAHAFGPVVTASQSAILWQWDLRGISTLIGCSFVPGLRWAFRCHPDSQSAYSIAVFALTISLLASSGGKPGTRRNEIFVGLACAACLLGLVALFHWTTFASTADRVQLVPPVLTMFAAYFVGFAFWKISPLERAWPGGPFDFCGSHTVWHILVIVAVYHWDHACSELLNRSWDAHDC